MNAAVTLLLLAPIGSQAGAQARSQAGSQAAPAEPGAMADGSGEFRLTPAANPAITVFFHRPAGAGRDARVVIALHGLLRQGAAVREAWRTLAEQHGFIVVVPQFDATGYRGSLHYNTGRVMVDGQATPPASWSFAVIEEVFDAVRARWDLSAASYGLYGHSAGGQFVHRFALLMPTARADRLVAANAGWYTLPTAEAGYPWGLQGLAAFQGDERGDERSALCRAFARPLLLLIGERDDDPAHEQLNRSPQAMAQGANRVARADHFFAVAQQRAAALGCPLSWTLQRVPDVGHEFDRMGAAAAAHLAAPRAEPAR